MVCKYFFGTFDVYFVDTFILYQKDEIVKGFLVVKNAFGNYNEISKEHQMESILEQRKTIVQQKGRWKLPRLACITSLGYGHNVTYFEFEIKKKIENRA